MPLCLGGVVPWGLAGGVSCGWRCAVMIGRDILCSAGVGGIGGEDVVWVALYRCGWRGGRRMAGVASFGLVGRASYG